MKNWMVAMGAAFGGLSVILGAVGAHSIRFRVSEAQWMSYHTAVQYQLFHSLALVLAGILAAQQPGSKILKWSGGCFAAGILLFCGTIYLKTLGISGFFTHLTPMGGMAFMAGWFTMAWMGIKK